MKARAAESAGVLHRSEDRRPGLAVTVVLAALLLLTVTPSLPAAAAPGTWLARINGFRASNGLGALTEDTGLDGIAQAWTDTMASSGTLAHNPLLSSQLPMPSSRFAENVGSGADEALVFETFISSTTHREKLLGPYNGVGIGQVFSGGRVWTTHVFVQTSSILRPPTSTTAAAGRSAGGMWTATGTGRVSGRAGAPSFGQLDVAPSVPVVGLAGTPTGSGYWLAATDGGIFAFGDAGFYGSTGGIRLSQPVVGVAGAASGRGYWLVASDGGIFAFGDAGFYGSTGAIRLNQPIVGMTATPTGRGYWLVASDGGIFAFGDAGFYGSTGSYSLVSPVTGITRSASGNGYRIVAADGGLFSFGDAPFFGSLGGTPLSAPVTAMASTSTGRGYWLVKADGSATPFGDAPPA